MLLPILLLLVVVRMLRPQLLTKLPMLLPMLLPTLLPTLQPMLPVEPRAIRTRREALRPARFLEQICPLTDVIDAH